jgi:hypothetical protein
MRNKNKLEENSRLPWNNSEPVYDSNAPSARIYRPMPEFIDPVFAKTSQNRSFSVIQNERFRLVFAKTGSIISGTSAWIYRPAFPWKQAQNARIQ